MAAEAILRCYRYFSAEAGMSSFEDDFRNFFHNPVHDMESIFWVIFLIAVNVESKDGLMRKKIDAILFTGSEDSALTRKDFVSSVSAAWGHYSVLFGPKRKVILEKLKSLSVILFKCYTESEANLPNGPIDDSKISGIHEKFRDVWKECKDYFAANGDVPMESGAQTDRTRTMTSFKRKAGQTHNLQGRRRGQGHQKGQERALLC